jgi:AraC-like DNA-binding protein
MEIFNSYFYHIASWYIFLLVVVILIFGTKTKANWILATLLFFKFCNLFSNILLQSQHDLLVSYHHYFIAIIYLLAPLFYLYTKAVTNPEFKFKPSQLLHFIIYPTTVALFIFSGYRLSKLAYILLVEGVLILQNLIYFLFIYKQINHYRQAIHQHYSNTKQMEVSWLAFFYSLYIASLLLFAVSILYNQVTGKLELVSFVIETFSLLLYMLIVFYGLKFQFRFKDQLKVSESNGSKLFDPEQKNEIGLKLTGYMERYKPYKNPEITILQLSIDAGIPVRELSAYINSELDKNFFEFINGYRLGESLTQMANEKLAKKTILEILYDSGFNSKSTFYDVFKKQFNCSPQKYRQMLFEKREV